MTQLSPWEQQQRRKPSSWVIRNKATGEAIAETFLPQVAAGINREKYEAIPIGEHLASLNRKSRETEPPER